MIETVIIATAGIVIATVLRLFNPEIRHKLGLDNNINFEEIDSVTTQLLIDKKKTKIKCRSIKINEHFLNYLPELSNTLDEELYNQERLIRRTAYTNKIKEVFNESFFDDSDMEDKDYYLHIIYNDHSKKGLISARSYSNLQLVLKEIDPPNGGFYRYDFETGAIEKEKPNEALNDNPNGNFVIDRLGSIVQGSKYKNYPEELLFALLYRRIYKCHSNSFNAFILARFSETQYLLSKYIKLGFRIIGVTKYEVGSGPKLHWCLFANMNDTKQTLKQQSKLIRSIIE